MFSSLRSRLWLSYALLIGAALGVVGIFLLIYLLRKPLLYRQAGIRLRLAESVILARQDNLAGVSPAQLQAALDRSDQTFEVRAVVFAPDGRVLADSRLGRAAPIALPPVPLIPRENPVLRDAGSQPWLYSMHQLDVGGWLLLAVPRPKVPLLAILRDELFLPFAEAGVTALLLSLLLAYLLSRWVADPLQRMLAAARGFPAGQPRRLPLEGPREVQTLTGAFNEMTARVQAGQKSQRDFVANVSHELKTPLTSIQGFAQAILDGTADTPEARAQAAGVIHAEAGRMHRLVLDLLDLARLDAGTADLQRAAVDMAALLNMVAEKFSLQTGQANVALQVEAAALPTLSGDGDRLAQVFTNLVDNALKYTPAGGQVTLRAAAIGGQMEVTVSDSGAGIPPEALPHIFERFYQADPARRGGEGHGSGLGLAIAREIVLAHGGTITARSTPPKGSTIVVRLPLASPEASTIISRRKKS